MIDHVGINCANYAESQRFYDAVLGTLGFSRQLDVGPAIGYGRAGKPTFWISDAPAGPNREVHLAFEAADEDAVRAFHRAAVELGARCCTRRGCGPNTTPLFRCVRARPRRNNVEAVWHGA